MDEDYKKALIKNINTALRGLNVFLSTEGSLSNISETSRDIIDDAVTLIRRLEDYKRSLETGDPMPRRFRYAPFVPPPSSR